MSKQGKLDAAEVFDSWRVVPRIIVAFYLGLFGWSIVYIGVKYFQIPAIERTVQLTAFCTVWLGAMTTAFPFVVKIYQDNGRNWDAGRSADQPNPSA